MSFAPLPHMIEMQPEELLTTQASRKTQCGSESIGRMLDDRKIGIKLKITRITLSSLTIRHYDTLHVTIFIFSSFSNTHRQLISNQSD